MKEIRRKEKEITNKDELTNILQQTKYITIAMCQNNIPYIVTLTHGYDSNNNIIYFHCASEGKKIDILQDNNIVWGQALIDKGYVPGKCDHLYATTQFKGTVDFLQNLKEKEKALKIMIQQQEKVPTQVIEKQISEKSLQRVTIGRIHITQLSGKKSDWVIIS